MPKYMSEYFNEEEYQLIKKAKAELAQKTEKKKITWHEYHLTAAKTILQETSRKAQKETAENTCHG